MAKLLQTQRDQHKLIYDNFGYIKKRETLEKITWNCDRKSTKCRAYAITTASVQDGDHVEEYGEHNHEPDPSKYDIIAVKNTLKRRAVESMDESAKNLCSNLINEAGLASTTGLPRKETLERSIRRYRMLKRGPAVKKVWTDRSQNLDKSINEDFMAIEEENPEIQASPNRISDRPSSTAHIRTVGPIRTGFNRLPQNSGFNNRSAQNSGSGNLSTTNLEQILLLKERELEGKLKIQREKLQIHREKRAMYAKINDTVDKFDSAIDEFRRQVAEQRLAARGVDISEFSIDLPSGMRDIMNI